MADCDNGGVCEEVKCENKSVCYLGYNKEQNVRFRGCMLRDRLVLPLLYHYHLYSSNLSLPDLLIVEPSVRITIQLSKVLNLDTRSKLLSISIPLFLERQTLLLS